MVLNKFSYTDEMVIKYVPTSRRFSCPPSWKQRSGSQKSTIRCTIKTVVLLLKMFYNSIVSSHGAVFAVYKVASAELRTY